MVQTARRDGETFEQLLKRFRKHVAHAKILSDVKKHRFYMPKSERRKMARRKAQLRERRRRRRVEQQARR